MNSISLCGVTEIRTRDALLTHTRFPGVPLQPLEHHSNKLMCKGINNQQVIKVNKHFKMLIKNREPVL